MIKKYEKRDVKYFSLTEIIVSMAVFSVLLVMMLQFFTGAQKIWASSAQKNTVYASARGAMNMLASALQSMVFVPNDSPFRIAKDYSIIFVSKYPLSFKDGTRTPYVMKFSFKTPADGKSKFDEMQGKLVFQYIGPEHGGTTYKSCFGNKSDYSDFLSRLNTQGFVGATGTFPEQEIISGVTSFNVIPVIAEYGKAAPLKWESLANSEEWTPASGDGYPPIAVELRLSLMSPEDYSEWYRLNGNSADKTDEKAPAEKFRLSHEQSFNRLVTLGDYRPVDQPSAPAPTP